MNHEQLWAPWRLDYIKRDPAEKQREIAAAAALTLRPGADPACFMCRAVADHHDRQNLVVYRGQQTFAILNRFPYNNGHVLVAPLDHHGRLDDQPADVQVEALALITRLVQILERDLQAQGFNIGLNLGAIAGAGVPGHLHWHLVPRWSGDTNFMPVLAGVEIISQSLDTLYTLLHDALNPPATGAGAMTASLDSLGLTPISTHEREQLLLAPFAMHSADSAGRRYPEAVHPYRGPFQRDRDRIVHSSAYRRLSGKTQVFTGALGDYHRTRLTHTIEVASLARTLARALRLNEDLVEALAMMHDLGHPPFGHSGEDVLNECLREVGGFSHNGHTLRIVEELEERYPGFAGLNLSRETLEGQTYRVGKNAADRRPILEVQVVDAADSITYNSHDADDALELKLLTLDDLAEIPLWREAVARVRQRYSALADRDLKRAVVHELLVQQIDNILQHSLRRLEEHRPDSIAAVRQTPWIVEPGAELAEQKADLERFLYERVYRHPNVLKVRDQAQHQLRIMFAGFVADPGRLPSGFQGRIAQDGVARTVGDYLAGMTDRYAYRQFRKHFAPC